METFTTIYSELSQCVATPSVATCASASTPTVTLVLHVALGLICFVVAFATDNDSQVDRLWSIAPVLSAWVHALHTPRRTSPQCPWGPRHTYAALVTLWGARLSYNFYRRGGYSSDFEDYRWAHVRKWPVFRSRIVWEFFRFAFISLYQMVLLWAIALPIAKCPARYTSEGSCTIDTICSLAFLAMWAVEIAADQQQWVFQNLKRSSEAPPNAAVARDVRLGFLTRGLWQYSRHPNVFAEQSLWAIVYVAALAHAGVLFDGVGLGIILLVHVTVTSTKLTESLSSEKYPMYRVYRKYVCMLIPVPLLSRSALDAALDKIK